MTEKMRRQEGGLGLPEPHLPTTRDLYLGLGLAAIGVADITPAKDYVTRSGYYRLLPGNREERRRWHNESSKIKLPEEFSAIERRRLERFREFGHEGIPTYHHAAWIDPAASALLERAIDWVIQEGLSSRALDASDLLGWLYGAGRQPPTEFFDLTSNAIRHLAESYHQKRLALERPIASSGRRRLLTLLSTLRASYPLVTSHLSTDERRRCLSTQRSD